MKIVITGALGHIGSRVIRKLPSCFLGSKVVMIDNFLTQRYCSLYNLPSNIQYQFIEADVLTMDLDTVIAGADVVIHLAAITDAANSFNNKEEVENANYNAVVRVAEACSNNNCPMLHLSSTSVYGTQKEVVDEDCSESELNPQSPYAETKLKEERFLADFGRERKLRFVTCRFGTISGVSPGMRFHTAVNKFCWQAVMGQPITVWRTALHQKRPYLDLSDAVKAMSFIIEKDLFDNRIYNVLTDNLTVDSILNYVKKCIPVIKIKYVDAKIMNQLSYNVSNSRFINKGFMFKGDLEQSIAETINLLKGAYGIKRNAE